MFGYLCVSGIVSRCHHVNVSGFAGGSSDMLAQSVLVAYLVDDDD